MQVTMLVVKSGFPGNYKYSDSLQLIVFDVRRGPFQEPFYQCVTHGVYTAEWQEHLYTFFTLLFTFIVPLIILATTYLLTVYTLHRMKFCLLNSLCLHFMLMKLLFCDQLNVFANGSYTAWYLQINLCKCCQLPDAPPKRCSDAWRDFDYFQGEMTDFPLHYTFN